MFLPNPNRRYVRSPDIVTPIRHAPPNGAHVFYGLSLIFFGVAHFLDVKDTLSLIPNWLPATFSGCFSRAVLSSRQLRGATDWARFAA
jgi:hypothetical protein